MTERLDTAPLRPPIDIFQEVLSGRLDVPGLIVPATSLARLSLWAINQAEHIPYQHDEPSFWCDLPGARGVRIGLDYSRARRPDHVLTGVRLERDHEMGFSVLNLIELGERGEGSFCGVMLNTPDGMMDIGPQGEGVDEARVAVTAAAQAFFDLHVPARH